jgi:hypothetical protein
MGRTVANTRELAGVFTPWIGENKKGDLSYEGAQSGAAKVARLVAGRGSYSSRRISELKFRGWETAQA